MPEECREKKIDFLTLRKELRVILERMNPGENQENRQ